MPEQSQSLTLGMLEFSHLFLMWEIFAGSAAKTIGSTIGYAASIFRPRMSIAVVSNVKPKRKQRKQKKKNSRRNSRRNSCRRESSPVEITPKQMDPPAEPGSKPMNRNANLTEPIEINVSETLGRRMSRCQSLTAENMPEPVGQQTEHPATEPIEVTLPETLTAENMPEPVGQQTEHQASGPIEITLSETLTAENMPEPVGQRTEHQATEPIEITLSETLTAENMPEPVGQQAEHPVTEPMNSNANLIEAIEITLSETARRRISRCQSLTAENMPEPVGPPTEQDSHQASEHLNTSSPSETTEIITAEIRTRASTEPIPHKSKKTLSRIRSTLARAFAKDSFKVAPTAAVAIPNDSAIELHQNPSAMIYHPDVRAAMIQIIQQKVSREIVDPNAGTPAAIIKMMANMPKTNKEAYFGRPLAAYADLPGVNCPGLVHRCVEWLLAGDNRKTFGIFREATFPHAQKGVVAAYLVAPGAPLVVPDTPGVNPATTVACALKAFLVQLQEPLIPADLYATCLAMDCPQDLDALRLTLACLPRFQQGTIQALLRCAAAVSREEASNRMSSAALATCLAPCLLRPQELNHVDAAEASKHARALVEFMIDNVELLFTLPEGFQLPEPVLVPLPAETNLSKTKRKTRTFGLWKKFKKILA
ncbi:hypothetical protein HDU85_002769 [Gaertneriomyces sp. JEL0708]|nr:hypothetical protein HDU85_002769 [Gaertneriomyces sp. JEL0708]